MSTVGFKVYPDRERFYKVARTQEPMPLTGHHHLVIAKEKLDTKGSPDEVGLIEVFNLFVHPNEGPHADVQTMTSLEFEEFLRYVVNNAPFEYDIYDMTNIEDVKDQVEAFQDLISDIFTNVSPEDFERLGTPSRRSNPFLLREDSHE